MITLNKNLTLFEEISKHLLSDSQPSEYINQISKGQQFQDYPFLLLNKLKNTEQSKKYHPEGSVWNHTMLVVDEAAKVRQDSSNPSAFMWGSLLHDIGKPDTTRNRKGKITSYDHDKVGADLCKDFIKQFTEDEVFINKVSDMVLYHMHMLYVLNDLKFADTKNLIKKVNIEDLALLCRCDRLGRLGVDRQAEDNNYKLFLKSLNQQMKK